MRLIGVTARVDINHDYGERRDALDQNWYHFLVQCGLLPIILPNSIDLLEKYVSQFQFSGFLLSGGNSPVVCNGDAPERDEVEMMLINLAIEQSIPVVGVCRGMQMIQLYFNQHLESVHGHVNTRSDVTFGGISRTVNSFHHFAAQTISPPLLADAVSSDGVIKAVKHLSNDVYGIMWHPEREAPFDGLDIEFFKKVFNQ